MDESRLIQEVSYKAVRSSGAGGQNVNKVASKVELHFMLNQSEALSEDEKTRLKEKLQSRLTSQNELILQSDTSRSQHKNKELVRLRFLELIREGIKKQKPRKKTRVPKSAKLKRLKAKKIQSDKKANRQKPQP